MGVCARARARGWVCVTVGGRVHTCVWAHMFMYARANARICVSEKVFFRNNPLPYSDLPLTVIPTRHPYPL